MQITDDEETQDILAGKIAERLNVGNDRQSVDEIAVMVQALRQQGFEDAQITAQVMTANAIEKKMSRQFEAKLQNQRVATVQQNRDFLSSSELNRELRSIYKDEPELKNFDKAIKAEASALYFADKNLAARWERGEVDFEKMQEALDKTCDKFLNFGKTRSGESSNTAADPGKSKKSEDEPKQPTGKGVSDNGTYNIEELNEQQQAAFLAAKVGNRKYYGMEDPVEITKKAWEFAKSLGKPSHRGTRVGRY